MSNVTNEIGGYFGLECFAGVEYHPGALGVNSGRNALLYLLKLRGVKKLYIPRFLCDSVSRLCEREGVAYAEYAITEDFLPVFDRALDKDEYVYIVNFYGQLSNERIVTLKDRFGNVIVDNVQAFFQAAIPGVDTVYSCRKFFGVPDGGYVVTDAEDVLPLETDISKDRMRHILGRFEESGSAYYRDFQQNDELFYDLPLRGMSRLTRNILRAVDYDAVCQKRNANYAALEVALGAHNRLRLTVPNGPYCYPFYCKNGVEIKRQLAQKRIYVATLWPNVLSYDGTLEKDYAENVLPLPCDQRYGAEDMARIVSELLRQLG